MKNLIALLLFSIAFTANAERVDKTLEVDANGDIRVEVIEGKVVIEGWDKNEIRVTGNVPDLDQFVFRTSGDDTRIEVESKHGFWGNWKGGGYSKLTIYCPRGSSIMTEGASSSFAITGIEGSVNSSTMSGDISLQGGNGKVKLESVSGDVDIVDAKGKISLASVSGDVSAKVEARHFEAQSVSGSIDASIGMAEHVELESVSGDIELIFELAKSGELDADTVSGDIDIKFLNDDLDASFEIDTGPGGDIRNLVSDDKQSSSSFAFSGSLEFKVGKGRGSVNLETMSGTVKIDR